MTDEAGRPARRDVSDAAEVMGKHLWYLLDAMPVGDRDPVVGMRRVLLWQMLGAIRYDVPIDLEFQAPAVEWLGEISDAPACPCGRCQGAAVKRAAGLVLESMAIVPVWRDSDGGDDDG